MAVFDRNGKNVADHGNWSNEVYQVAKRCKPDSLKCFSHHGTKGFNYSFGNKPLYGMLNGSSVGTYQNKNSKSNKRQLVIDRDASWLQSMCANTIRHGIFSLTSLLPDVKHFLCPIINAAYTKQVNNECQLLRPMYNEDDQFWNAFLFVDGRTENYHVENDCSYTLITVPKQLVKTDISLDERAYFIFKIEQDRDLYLPLTPHLTFMYNASFLTHRQSYVPFQDKDEPRFYNISTYSNEKIFNHLRKSFQRLL